MILWGHKCDRWLALASKSAAVSTPSSNKLQIVCVVRQLASPILSPMLDSCLLQSLQCRATADPASSEPCDSAVIADRCSVV